MNEEQMPKNKIMENFPEINYKWKIEKELRIEQK